MGQLNEAVRIKEVLDYYDIENFVETGTGKAEVVRTVVDADSNQNIHTIEIMEDVYKFNRKKFHYLENVNWHLGNSFEVIPKILSELKSNTLFWLDAHFPATMGKDNLIFDYGLEPDLDKRLPLQKELEIITSLRDVSNDAFVIDDLRIYEDGDFETGNWDERSKYGGDGIDFIEELFGETHCVIRSYNAQGFIILLPLSTKDEDFEKLLLM